MKNSSFMVLSINGFLFLVLKIMCKLFFTNGCGMMKKFIGHSDDRYQDLRPMALVSHSFPDPVPGPPCPQTSGAPEVGLRTTLRIVSPAPGLVDHRPSLSDIVFGRGWIGAPAFCRLKYCDTVKYSLKI